MRPMGNDWWQGTFQVAMLGRSEYTVEAWIDHFATWQRDFQKRVEAGQDVTMDLMIGVELVQRQLPECFAGQAGFGAVGDGVGR